MIEIKLVKSLIHIPFLFNVIVDYDMVHGNNKATSDLVALLVVCLCNTGNTITTFFLLQCAVSSHCKNCLFFLPQAPFSCKIFIAYLPLVGLQYLTLK
jgi:hypothetical protein